ncbi:hypothetical protein CEXT_277761 [Caerostris extrusa]|uniref:Uncharacterized protein n=1 Tax=Caerostris extrusa TaxID=172846 RepID=A0AAV4NGY4_CAEEX|nr:hypothetical protein CEXT_277761 [Caerostris extrusa]
MLSLHRKINELDERLEPVRSKGIRGTPKSDVRVCLFWHIAFLQRRTWIHWTNKLSESESVVSYFGMHEDYIKLTNERVERVKNSDIMRHSKIRNSGVLYGMLHYFITFNSYVQ